MHGAFRWTTATARQALCGQTLSRRRGRVVVLQPPDAVEWISLRSLGARCRALWPGGDEQARRCRLGADEASLWLLCLLLWSIFLRFWPFAFSSIPAARTGPRDGPVLSIGD